MKDRRSSSLLSITDSQWQADVLRCSFCGLGEGEVARLFEGRNDNYICNECVEVSAKLLADYQAMGWDAPMLRVPWYRKLLRSDESRADRCSFCSGRLSEGERMLPGQQVQICERCIRACDAIKTSDFGI
jgi:ATP-dependent protease Clp ATPase subunit